MQCAVGADIKDGGIISTNTSVSGTPIHIDFTRGTAWTHTAKIGIANLKIIPQIAVWVEDTNGNFKQNIYVTRCFGKQDWKFLKGNPDSTYRTSSLPYWMNKMGKVSIAPPTRNNPLPDAVTAATPTGSFMIKSMIDSSIKQGILFCEINSSFDNNETFTKDRPEPYNGQPSVVYSGKFDVVQTGTPIKLVYKGHGGEAGKDSTLYSDSKGITTALNIIVSIRAVLLK